MKDKDVIVALDFSETDEVKRFLRKFHGRQIYTKVGMELFYSQGPDIVKRIKDDGHKVFLDLKLHDIPNTVEKSMRVLGGLGVDMTNLHCSGTKKMMEAGLRGLSDGSPRNHKPILIGVTMLTSTSQRSMKEEIFIEDQIENIVLKYGALAKSAGLQGVVCSSLESPLIHENLGTDFITVTPGIRFESDDKGDQERVTTPEKAKTLGSDYIVVGRSITGSADPVAAYEKCLIEFCDSKF